MTHISHATSYIDNHVVTMHIKLKTHNHLVTTDNLSKVTQPTVSVTTHHITMLCNPSDFADILCANTIQHNETSESSTSSTTFFSYIFECITKFFSNAFRYESSTTNRMKIDILAIEITMNKPCWALTFLVFYHGWDPPIRQASSQLLTVLFRLWWHHGINALGRARSCCVDGDYLLLHATYSMD